MKSFDKETLFGIIVIEVIALKIFVGCSSSNDIPDQYREDCNVLLDELFHDDNELVFGACRSGMMGDSYHHALNNHRNVVGICPEAYKDDFKNLKCTTEMVVKRVSERTDCLIKESDVLLFLPGGIGTIYELFTSIESKRCHEHDREIIIYNSCDYYAELFDFLNKLYRERFTNDEVKQHYFISNRKEEIVSHIKVLKKEGFRRG